MYFSPTNQLKKSGNGDRRNRNSDFVPASTVSPQREPSPYICGLGARFGYERV